MTVISVNNASVTAYGKALLSNIELTADAGEIIAILGPNGAGKTSLLNTISGEMTPSSGTSTFLEVAPANWENRALAKQMAVLPQFSLLSFPFSVEEVVRLGRTPHDTGQARDREISLQCLDRLDASHLRDRLYTELSGGERQRVQLARVLSQIWCDETSPIAEQRCLLLDEPTAALDLALRAKVLTVLREFARNGCAIILVLHDFNLAAQYADRLILLHQGSSMARGTAQDVLTAENIKEVFNVDAHIIDHPDNGRPVVVPSMGLVE